MSHRRTRTGIVLGVVLLLAWAGTAAAEDGRPSSESAASATTLAGSLEARPILLAQDGGTAPRELEPRYEAPRPDPPGPYNEQERKAYNSDYMFGMTRGLANSTMVPALKGPLFLFTVPLDIVFLPFAAIGGFF